MPKQKQKKNYSFPILKRKEIVSCLKEINILINDSDLRDPREDRMKIIYSDILCSLMGIDIYKKNNKKNNSNNKENQNAQIFDDPSLHTQSLYQVRLFREMIKLMQCVGVADFSIADLISPSHHKTVRNLSAIVNFAKFRASKWEMYSSHKTVISDLKSKYNALIKKNGSLAKDFVRVKKRVETEAPLSDALKVECKEESTKIEKLMHSYNEQQIRIKSIKTATAEYKNKLSKLKIEINNSNDQIQSLQTKIVRSPKRIKNELRERSESVKNEKLEINKMISDLKKQEQLISDLNDLKSLIQEECLTTMKCIDQMKNEKLLQNQSEFDKLIGELACLKNEKKTIDKQKKNIELKLKNKKIEYQTQQFEYKKLNHQIDACELKIKEIELEFDETCKQTKVDMNHAQLEIDNVKQSIVDELQRFEKEKVELFNKFREINVYVLQYHNQIADNMNTWN